MTFGLDIAKWVEDTDKHINVETTEKVKKLFKQVILNSPRLGVGKYSTGHFIHNWQIGFFPVGGELPGTATQTQKFSEIDTEVYEGIFKDHHTIYFTNSTHYAKAIEEDGWFRPDGSPGHGPYAPVVRAIAAMIE